MSGISQREAVRAAPEQGAIFLGAKTEGRRRQLFSGLRRRDAGPVLPVAERSESRMGGIDTNALDGRARTQATRLTGLAAFTETRAAATGPRRLLGSDPHGVLGMSNKTATVVATGLSVATIWAWNTSAGQFIATYVLAPVIAGAYNLLNAAVASAIAVQVAGVSIPILPVVLVAGGIYLGYKFVTGVRDWWRSLK